MEPNSSLIICAGIPWERNYRDLRKFTNATEQHNYIVSKAAFTPYNDFSYIRQTGKIRVNIQADLLRGCNYIAYRNTGYVNKWFYAFVAAIEYVNDGVSLITFDEDIYQTWLFQLQIMPSFVEREHVNDDTPGANTVPENIITGEPVVQTRIESVFNYHWFIYATELPNNPRGSWKAPGSAGNEYSGCYLQDMGTDLSAIGPVIESFTKEGKADAVVSVFASPFSLTGQSFGGPARGNFQGYEPRNNKLHSYPFEYCVLCVPGTEKIYRYEFMTPAQPSFMVYGEQVPNGGAVIIPRNYEDGSTSNPQADFAVVANGWRSAAWVSDSYQNMIAQQGPQLAMSVGANIAQTIGGLVTGNVPGAMSGLTGVLNTVANLRTELLVSNTISGTAALSNVFFANGLSLCVKRMGITKEYAQIIDEFFDKFGYKVCRLKVPNTDGRANWNYVKTIDSIVRGDAPEDAISKFMQILDVGTTFWHTNDIGNYTLTNEVVTNGQKV